jgi:hypothetical protein
MDLEMLRFETCPENNGYQWRAGAERRITGRRPRSFVTNMRALGGARTVN